MYIYFFLKFKSLFFNTRINNNDNVTTTFLKGFECVSPFWFSPYSEGCVPSKVQANKYIYIRFLPLLLLFLLRLPRKSYYTAEVSEETEKRV